MAINPFISDEYLRFRYFEDATEWETVQAVHVFQDGTPEFNELSDTAPKEWEYIYEFDRHDQEELDALEIFDAFYEDRRKSRVFEILTKKGIETDVRFKDYKPDHPDNKYRFQTRRIILKKYKYAPGGSLSVETRKPTVPVVSVFPIPADTIALRCQWAPSVAFAGRQILKYFVKFNGGDPMEVVGQLFKDVGSLDFDHDYFFQVAAYDGTYISDYSAPVHCKTDAAEAFFTVEMATPASGEVISGTAYAFTSNVQETGNSGRTITEVQYFADGVAIGKSTNALTNFRLLFNTQTNLSNGAHQFHARAKDNASTPGFYTSPTVSATVANTPAIKPAAPTNGIVDDDKNTFSWTNSPGYTSTADYEFTTDGGLNASPVTGKALAITNVPKAAGQVGVRVKAPMGGEPSDWLFNTVPFTYTPPAPANVYVNDVDNELDWDYVGPYTSPTDYRYTINGGLSYADVLTKPIGSIVGIYPAGKVGIQVKANLAELRKAGDTKFTTQPFTNSDVTPTLSGYILTGFSTLRTVLSTAADSADDETEFIEYLAAIITELQNGNSLDNSKYAGTYDVLRSLDYETASLIDAMNFARTLTVDFINKRNFSDYVMTNFSTYKTLNRSTTPFEDALEVLMTVASEIKTSS